MSDAMQELASRLVVGHKSDGRAVYDEAVKAAKTRAVGAFLPGNARLTSEVE